MSQGKIIVRVFRSVPSMEQHIVVAQSDDMGKTWKPIAMCDTLEIEREIVEGAQGVTGSFLECDGGGYAQYIKPKKPDEPTE